MELIDGDVVAMSPSPGSRHQSIQLKLASRMDAYFECRACRPFIAPLDVKLSADTVVQPDLMVVCRREQIRPTHIEGAPALVVEILSDSTGLYDRHVKLRLYARHGVREVWLVTPCPGLVEVFLLDGETYRFITACSSGEILRSPSFPGLDIGLDPVFDFPFGGQDEIRVVKEDSAVFGNGV